MERLESKGGGTHRYSKCHGDVPMCIARDTAAAEGKAKVEKEKGTEKKEETIQNQ